MEPLAVGGFVPFSSVDFPGKLSAVVFCQGCHLRCSYCQNPHLVSQHGKVTLPWNEVLSFLAKRQSMLEGVVFSGGEPLLQQSLPAAMDDVRKLGFEIGLHTAGPSPSRLSRVLEYTNWIGLDFKAPFAEYARVTGSDTGQEARESLRLLRDWGGEFEVRTTVDPSLISDSDLLRMAEELSSFKVKRYTLQRCRGCYSKRDPLNDRLLLNCIARYVPIVQVRQ